MQQLPTKLKDYFLKDINPIIRFLIISDTILIGAAGLLGPIFAIFIEEFIQGGNETIAGTAAGIYLFSRSILQIPIARLIDTIRGERDDFWFMFIFTFFVAIIPLFYLVISTPIQLYIIQFVLGLCTAFTFPAYMAIFTRHIDKGKEGTEWGIYFTLTDLAGAVLAIVGGYVAVSVGFPVLIIACTTLSLIGALLLGPIKPYIKTASSN
ncbi:MFS transporter [Patescibacteria group bacterium]|nr:MFS transporter [Patescibacteria group bacterium]